MGEPRLDRGREGVAVDAQILPRWHAGAIGCAKDERAELAQLLFQEAGGDLGHVGLEGVRADEFGRPRGPVGRRGLVRPHLEEFDRDAAPRELPGRFGPGQSCTDDQNGFAHPFYPRSGRSAPRARRAS